MEIETKLFTIFESFIRDLSKTYPEIKNCLYRNYDDCLSDQPKKLSDLPKLQKFLDNLHKYESLITKKDETFFTQDIEYLEDISFDKLWSKNISDKTRETLWKYFQTFTLISINLKSNDALQNALQSIQDDNFDTDELKDKKVAKDLKKIKKLSQEVQKEIGENEDELDLENMMKPLMDSGIGSIAKEVAETMDIEGMFGSMNPNANPMELMAQMMNPDKMGSIFQNINQVMEKKKESGEFSEESLKKEAEGMYGQMGNNPLFGNLMNQMNPDQMHQAKKSGGNEGNEGKEERGGNETKEENREKLKKKLREKKEERNKK